MGADLRLLNRTVPPSGPAAGDTWYRADTDRVEVSDGQAGEPITVGPVGNVPVVASTRWHALPGFGNAAAVAMPNERLFAIPFYPGRSCTLTGIAVNVTLALVGGVVRLGLYESDGALPTDLVADYGTLGVGLTGIQSLTGLTAPVRPVLHYIVLARQFGGLSLSISGRSSTDPMVATATPVIASNPNAYYIDGVGGALPASFGAPAGTDQGPCFRIQLT